MQADGRSFMKIVNSSGPSILPCGTPERTRQNLCQLPELSEITKSWSPLSSTHEQTFLTPHRSPLLYI
ncbi:hypothetical protein ACHWQZ_G008040 [Mnemiopsis leidyi]